MGPTKSAKQAESQRVSTLRFDFRKQRRSQNCNGTVWRKLRGSRLFIVPGVHHQFLLQTATVKACRHMAELTTSSDTPPQNLALPAPHTPESSRGF